MAHLFGGGSFSGNTASFFCILGCLHLQALFLEKYALIFRSQISRVILGCIVLFCGVFPSFCETCAFSLGLFHSNLCSVIFWGFRSFVFQANACFHFWVLGRPRRRLGLFLGPLGLGGPRWARERFFHFFGSCFGRRKWPLRFR